MLFMIVLFITFNNLAKSSTGEEFKLEEKLYTKSEVSMLNKIKLACGTIETIELTPGARKPSYTMYTNFGRFGRRVSVGQFVSNYDDMGSLINRKVWAVLNFPPRRIAGVRSEYLTVGFYDGSENAVLLNNRGIIDIEDGTQIVGTSQNEDLISFEDFTGANITAARVEGIESDLLIVNIGKGAIRVPLKESLDSRISPDTLMGKSVVVSVDPLDQLHELLYFRTPSGAVPIGFDKEEEILLGNKLG